MYLPTVDVCCSRHGIKGRLRIRIQVTRREMLQAGSSESYALVIWMTGIKVGLNRTGNLKFSEEPGILANFSSETNVLATMVWFDPGLL